MSEYCGDDVVPSDINVSPEAKAKAKELKDNGNRYLTISKFSLAADQYAEAIALDPTDPIFYANRAQAYIKMESYGAAILDANSAIILDPTYIKAYYRRASANFALGKTKEAKKDLVAVVKMHPSDADAQKKLKACKTAIQQEKLSNALGYGDDDRESTTIEVDKIIVDSSYIGPRLGDGESPPVTMGFIMEVMEHFKQQKILHRKYVIQILLQAKGYFKSVSSLLNLSLPEDISGNVGHFTVCGDTHGQYYDLCNIFNIGGLPSPDNPYLFNGDFVDRGSFSFETLMLLILFKLQNPLALYMLRGNHETKNMNKIYGFEGEVKHKYDQTVMNLFTAVFNELPLAAVIQDSVFVVHGGLSTDTSAMTLEAISSIQRGREPPESGLMSDLLWSDPQQFPGRLPSKRGVGYSFGPDYTKNFLEKNNLKLLVRSHEVKQEGYVVEHDGKCITIFSAPNYCDQMGNKGAFIRFYENMEPTFTQYDAVPHPNVPPMQYASSMLY